MAQIPHASSDRVTFGGTMVHAVVIPQTTGASGAATSAQVVCPTAGVIKEVYLLVSDASAAMVVDVNHLTVGGVATELNADVALTALGLYDITSTNKERAVKKGDSFKITLSANADIGGAGLFVVVAPE